MTTKIPLSSSSLPVLILSRGPYSIWLSDNVIFYREDPPSSSTSIPSAFFLAQEENRDFLESGERRLPTNGPFLSTLERLGKCSRRLENRRRSSGIFDDRLTDGAGNDGPLACPTSFLSCLTHFAHFHRHHLWGDDSLLVPKHLLYLRTRNSPHYLESPSPAVMHPLLQSS